MRAHVPGRSLLLSWFVLVPCLALAQLQPNRLPQPLDETNLTVLKGNTHPLARPVFDRGRAPDDLPLDRMLLVLRRSLQQQNALNTLLSEQQQRSSPNFHVWLTPDQFGHQFGPTEQDIGTVTSWLISHGLQVNSLARGRGVIEFSGTAGQLKQAFHTEMHKYAVNGKEHWANASDPQIPTAIAPMVVGIASLYDFPRKPLHRVLGTASGAIAGSARSLQLSPSMANPLLTGGGNCGLALGYCYALSPYDLATIYNILPLWNASSPIDGTGQTIAIVAQSDIYPQDFHDFRQDFGLPAGTLNMIYNGTPPVKLASQGDELESDLDVEWSGSVAKGATIDFVASATTNVTAGVDLSALYIVDNNLAPVLSESYGACELELGTAGNQFYNQLWQQAAAEGITVFVSTGDSGSAVCDRNAIGATQGLSVNGISSTPYNVAVGGTDFADLLNQTAYWNSTNDPVTQASAKSYVPESTWNDSCSNSELFVFTGDATADAQCNDPRYLPGLAFPVGGSGGASNCTSSSNGSLSSCSGGYAKPAWQSGPGVPNDGKRDLPDVSLFAGDGLNSSFYLVCETDIYDGCAGQIFSLVALGGTSASAPAFAGIMAMINQKTQSRQGNANFVFYPLAAQPGASCDSTGTLGPSCIFYDITSGTIAMPCVAGSADCVTNSATDLFGVLSGYNATPGYDPATGLGSVNVANLVNNWSSVSFQATKSTLSLSPTTNLTHGSPVNVDIAVTPTGGSGVPSGQISLLTSNGQPAGIFTLANGAASGTTTVLPGGSYTVTAHYPGDGIYGASDSAPGIPLTVSPESSTTVLDAFTLDQNGNSTPFTSGPYGQAVVYLRATVAGKSGQGVPTGTVNLTQTLNGITTNVQGDPFALNVNGYTLDPLPGYYYISYPPGTYSFGGTYSGDASFHSSSASPVTFTVTQATTNTTTNIVGCSPGNGVCVFTAGSFVEIFANVNYTDNSVGGVLVNAPTGTVTFYSNGTPLGPPVPVDSNIVPPIASFSTTQLLGTNNITAQYSGDSNYTASLSAATVVEVGQTFAITANPTVINVAAPGQSGSTTLTFAAQNGLVGSTSLTSADCSNLPPMSSCSFSPSTISFTSSSTTVPVTFTVTTTAPSKRTAAANNGRFGPASLGIAVLLVGTIVMAGSARRRHPMLLTLMVLAFLSCAPGCGGGAAPSTSGSSGGGGGGGGGNNFGTPVGTYSGITVTVTINGVRQSINNLTVNVQ